MDHLSYKAFMEQVRQRLDKFSIEELRNLVIEWAATEVPDKRYEFLSQLQKEGKDQQAATDTDELMEEIAGFYRDIADGEYFEGYGWDDELHEERDFGDESWTEVMDDFLLKARDLLREGDYETAEEVYRKLLDIFEMGEEPGHLPGDLEYNNMLETDLREHVALYLRALYLNTESENRVQFLYDAIMENDYLVSPKIKLVDVRDSLDDELPGFDDFLSDWIAFLKTKTPSLKLSELLREAVLLEGGISAISEFARDYADQFPKAYRDWIKALEVKGDHEPVLQAVMEGLDKIPSHYAERAPLAEKLAEMGHELGDNDLKLRGFWESFYSDPSIGYLLDLYITAEEEGCLDVIREDAETRMEELKKMRGKRDIVLNDMERRHSAISDGEYIHGLLLSGRYQKVFEMCKGTDSLGWSFGGHPKPVMLIFLMDVLSGERQYSKMLQDQWVDIMNRRVYFAQETDIEKYRSVMNRVKDEIHFTEEEEVFYLDWCKKETGNRVDAIVSNKHRGSYFKAAKILVAMGETLANRGSKKDGLAFVEKYRDRYPRHSAFKREVTDALQASEL